MFIIQISKNLLVEEQIFFEEKLVFCIFSCKTNGKVDFFVKGNDERSYN